MSTLGSRRGSLTAGGHRVHRVAKKVGSDMDDTPRRDERTPAIEAFTTLSAQHIHRVATLPCEDRFLSGCTCGWAQMSVPGVSEAEAKMEGAKHAIDEAKKLQHRLENPGEGASRG
jgi:hypothetical protein